jgi:S1-C subfamily serine protease
LGLRPPEFWQTVDLEPGDVVLSVNGKPIERDTQAFEAFESLRTAERITVVFERQGIERQLDFGIVDDPAAK